MTACAVHERVGSNRGCLHCQLAEARLALRRLASTETFTVPIDLRRLPERRSPLADELHARMRFAAETVAELDRARREAA